ncbi:GtrA family protein [bacterium 1XD21-13]|nr:GtrA family protein [bacterium 1XD21-13]
MSLHILGATVIARLVSSLFNYWYNRKLVFQDQGNVKSSLAKYYLLCIFVMLCSGGMVTLLSFLPVPNTIIKALVDTILYLFNYYIQRHFVFSYQANIEGL